MRFKAKNYKHGVDWTWAHVKLDGHRVEVRWDMGGDLPILRVLKPKQDITLHVDHLSWYDQLLATLPLNHCLEGELWVPGRKASHVSRAIAERHDDLKFTAFCVPSLAADMSILEVDKWLCQNAPGVDFAAWYHRAHYDPTKKDEIPFESDRENAHFVNREGWVLKQGNMLNWYKLKDERTIDLEITGTKDGSGKYLGLIGSLLGSITMPNGSKREVANVSGMTEDERTDMSLDDHLIGKVMEVKYQYVGDGGRLRHPRFVRIRDDKEAHECTADQDEALEVDDQR